MENVTSTLNTDHSTMLASFSSPEPNVLAGLRNHAHDHTEDALNVRNGIKFFDDAYVLHSAESPPTVAPTENAGTIADTRASEKNLPGLGAVGVIQDPLATEDSSKTLPMPEVSDEIIDLELRMSRLEGRILYSTYPGAPRTSMWSGYAGRQFCKASPCVNLLTLDDYDKRDDHFRERPHAMIDVVVGNDYPLMGDPGTFMDSKNNDSQNLAATERNRLQNECKEEVKFVQVNSIPFKHLYCQTLGIEPNEDFEAPIVVLAPFKTFTAYQQDFQDILRDLQTKWQTQEMTDPRAGVRIVQRYAGEDKNNLTADERQPMKNICQNGSLEMTSQRKEQHEHGVHTTDLVAEGPKHGVQETTRDKLPSDLVSVEQDTARKTQITETQCCEQSTNELDRYDMDDLTRDSYEAYLSLKCWHECYQRFFQERWEWMRSERMTNIRFGDLCDLFQPGDDVYERAKPQRVWRVLRVTGGRPVLQHLLYGKVKLEASKVVGQEGSVTEEAILAPKLKHESDANAEGDNENRSWTDLVIEGYYLDYDGREFGPVQRKTIMKYFHGQKSIKSLSAWPLRFSKKGNAEYETLTKHGPLFFDKCQRGLYLYEGRTLTELACGDSLDSDNSTSMASSTARPVRAQDITSPVYVDFETTLRHNPDWTPIFGTGYFYDIAAGRETTGGKSANLPPNSKFRHCSEIGRVLDIQSLTAPEIHATTTYSQFDAWYGPDGDRTTQDRKSIDPVDRILLPNRVIGFVFQTRAWGKSAPPRCECHRNLLLTSPCYLSVFRCRC